MCQASVTASGVTTTPVPTASTSSKQSRPKDHSNTSKMSSAIKPAPVARVPLSRALRARSAQWTAALCATVMSLIIGDTGRLAMFIGFVVIVGIPHGALDHKVGTALVSADGLVARHVGVTITFYMMYLGVMALFAFMWQVIPLVATLLFLAASIYHFGQGDLEEALIDVPSRMHRTLAFVSRGMAILGLAVCANPAEALFILASMSGLEPEGAAQWANGFDAATLRAASVALVVQQFVVLCVLLRRSSQLIPSVLDFAGLSAVLVVCDPVSGFAIYFAMWHSLDHMRRLAALLGNASQGGASWSVSRAYCAAIPYSAIAVAGILASSVCAVQYDLGAKLSSDRMHTIKCVFLGLGVIAMPHIVLVEELLQHQKPTRMPMEGVGFSAKHSAVAPAS
eukprot:Opistho-2@18597